MSDGGLDSNLATVSLTVTAVNDAPVVADVQATTAEDTALVIALGAHGSDVDGNPVLAIDRTTSHSTSPSNNNGQVAGYHESPLPQIVAGPAHGVFVQNADGTYIYTPDVNYNAKSIYPIDLEIQRYVA